MSFISKLKTVVTGLVVLVAVVGCQHRMAPTSTYSGSYNASDNSTDYEVLPYGKVTMPGKWIAGMYNKTSRKQVFYRDDTTTLTVVIAPCASSPFSKDGMTGYEFVRNYYKVEAQYQTEFFEQTPKLLVEDKENRYMLWMVHSDGIDQYFLCGVKDCSCDECTYRSFNLKNRRLSEAQSKKLLQDIFLGEK